jgi:RND family efflux transporter MFP subunit
VSTDSMDRHPASRPDAGSRAFRVLGTLIGIVILLGGAAALSWWIQSTEPVAQREAATRRSAALVETVVVQRGTHRPRMRVLGAVRPAREIVLSPRVSGEILAVEKSFRPGGLIRAGAPLLKIDAADYEQALVMREGEMGQVKAELEIEEGQQRAAELEFKLLGEDIDPANRSLVLREPQIASLRAKLRTAQAAVAQARLELGRTRIVAPFDAQILERFVELGSQVSSGDRLARLVGTDEYWVIATVPLSKVRWIRFAKKGEAGAKARIHHRAVWLDDQHREGVVERLIGEVDASTRLGRVIVSVPRPLGGDGEPRMILGTVVQVDIEAAPLVDVVRLPNRYLRQDDTVWVMDSGELRIRKADVLFSDHMHAYIRSGVDAGERVVTTSLATVVDGLPIREAAEGESSQNGKGDQR